MLRISVARERAGTAIGLEGRLTGPWVDELRACWRALLAERRAGGIRVDLHGVTFVDASGKALLRVMHEHGADLAATGCMTRAIVEEITGRIEAAAGACATGLDDDLP